MSGLTRGDVRRLALLCLCAALAATVGQAEESTHLPWALRDHYSFSWGKATFVIDVQTAEWKVDLAGASPMIDHVEAEVLLEDGSTYRLSELGKAADERDKTSSPLGEGMRFRSIFRARDGLVLRYAVTRFTERPFLLLHMDAENQGSAPITLRALRPVVVAGNTSAALPASLRADTLPLTRRGGFPVLREDRRGNLMYAYLGTQGTGLGVGVLQAGEMDSTVSLAPSGGSWQGNIECRFDPPLRLEPGVRVQADPVWVAFGMEDVSMVRQLYSWVLSTDAGSSRRLDLPPAWFTVANGESAEALYGAARRWAGTNILHALVPRGWEGRPGSLKGASPFYPQDLRQVAKELRARGLKPGITVEPLLAGGGKNPWTARSKDGVQWLNPLDKRARSHGIDRMKKVAGWGFEFIVVAPSAIPDSVLLHFNATRAQADSAAFEIAAAAAGDLPVLPASGLELHGKVPAWDRVGGATKWFDEYGLNAGPVRFNVDGLDAISPALRDAVAAFSGPVEIIGQPGTKVRRQISALFPLPVANALEVQAKKSTQRGGRSTGK